MEVPAGETVDVPFFIPVDAEHITFERSPEATIEMMEERGPTAVAGWRISAAHEGTGP